MNVMMSLVSYIDHKVVGVARYKRSITFLLSRRLNRCERHLLGIRYLPNMVGHFFECFRVEFGLT